MIAFQSCHGIWMTKQNSGLRMTACMAARMHALDYLRAPTQRCTICNSGLTAHMPSSLLCALQTEHVCCHFHWTWAGLYNATCCAGGAAASTSAAATVRAGFAASLHCTGLPRRGKSSAAPCNLYSWTTCHVPIHPFSCTRCRRSRSPSSECAMQYTCQYQQLQQLHLLPFLSCTCP